MNFTKMLIALFFISAVSLANAEICKSMPGNLNCAKGEINHIKANGIVSVNGTTVSGVSLVNGMLSADNASFSSLEVNGSSTISKSSINKDARIKGSLIATSSFFKQSLDLYSNYARINATHIDGNINIHHINDSKPKVFLENDTKVSGDIIFDDGNGTVVMSKGAKISGKVIGGKIINN